MTYTAEQLALRAKRLDELSDAVAKGNRSEFTMRVPAEPDRDADLVLQDSARIVRDYAALLERQAAGVTDEVVRTALCHWFEDSSGEGLVRGTPETEGWFARMRAALEAALSSQPAPHPDDAAVDRFAAAMKAKLAAARAKGRGGWQDKTDCPQQRLSDMLRAHVAKGDPCDVANFAMFLHQRGESILPAQPAERQGERSAAAAVTGWTVSVDVSSGEDDAEHRIFGRVIGYNDDRTLLAVQTEDNTHPAAPVGVPNWIRRLAEIDPDWMERSCPPGMLRDFIGEARAMLAAAPSAQGVK